MMETDLKGYLNEADGYVAAGDWQAGYEALLKAAAIQPEDASIQTALGACLLQMGEVDRAVPFYENAARLVPDLAQIHSNLGGIYRLAGRLEDAEHSLSTAASLDPSDADIAISLAVVYLQQNKMMEGVSLLASVVRSHPQNVDALSLLGQCYEEGDEPESARHLYLEVLKLEPDHAVALEGLKRLPRPVADPTRIARPEHAAKLAALKGLKKNNGSGAPEPARASKPGLFSAYRSVAFYAPAESSAALRMELLSGALVKQGLKTKHSNLLAEADFDAYDILYFAQPNLSGELIQSVSKCIERRKPFVVEVDHDYFELPPEHPAYHQVGPGNPRALQALEILLSEAEWVSVPSSELAERYTRRLAAYPGRPHRVEILPPVWDRSNRLWDKPASKRKTVNIGWLGSLANRDDLLMIKSELVKFIRAVPDGLLVIAGDPAAYGEFGMLSESRRLFLPATGSEDIPYILSQFDVLVVPLAGNDYNAACSDQSLMEAGVRRIPWVASSIRSHLDWKDGGRLVDKPGGWFAALKELAGDAHLRAALGAEGRIKAEQREIDCWLNG